MCQIKAYLLILNTGSSAVLSPGVSGPVTSTRHVHPAGIKPEEKCVNSQNKRSGMEFLFYNLFFYGGICERPVLSEKMFFSMSNYSFKYAHCKYFVQNRSLIGYFHIFHCLYKCFSLFEIPICVWNRGMSRLF